MGLPEETMRRCSRKAALAAALAVLAGADAAEALAGQAKGNLAVTVRVVDRCGATTAGRGVAQACTGQAPAALSVLESAPKPAGRAAPAVAVGAAFVTVIY